MSNIYIRPYKYLNRSLKPLAIRHKKARRRSFLWLAVVSSLLVHLVFLAAILLINLPQTNYYTALTLSSASPYLTIITFPAAVAPTEEPDEAITSSQPIINGPAIVSNVVPPVSSARPANPPATRPAPIANAAAANPVLPVTPPPLPAAEPVVPQSFQLSSLVLNAAGRSFREWPNFNFYLPDNFTALQKNVTIELTITGDGRILDTTIITSSGNTMLDNRLLSIVQLASFTERVNTPLQVATLTIHF
ncbi:MAG: energy transducer TonB [Spirochaetaceae bacterium]|nr:energy transducer TonB [Spirochaetaceae bacterium]